MVSMLNLFCVAFQKKKDAERPLSMSPPPLSSTPVEPIPATPGSPICLGRKGGTKSKQGEAKKEVGNTRWRALGWGV